jgi:rSAM/selenodomain-associated transferase 1
MALQLMRHHLVLFVRAPQLGTGKRRLARDIGDIAALRFERLMLALLLRRLGANRRWQLRIAVTPDKACQRIRCWRGQIETIGQGRGDLGARMLRALRACPTGPVVLVGSDIPALRARHIAAAFRLLGSHDLVFGPAKDGGFWLVGARHPRRLPHLFERVRWSGPHALADTLAGLPRGLTVGFADRLEDVDDGDAYAQLLRLTKGQLWS